MCGKTPRDPPKRAERKEIKGQAILTSELPTMNTQKKRKKYEIDTTTQKKKKKRKEKWRNQKLTTDYQEKEKRKGKEEHTFEKM